MSAPIDTERLHRAIYLDVRPVAPGTYLVSGGTDSHTVVIDGGLVRCSCIDSQRVGDQCKHALIARLYCGDPSVVVALRMLVARPMRSVRAA